MLHRRMVQPERSQRRSVFFGKNGSLKINDGEPSIGWPAITKAAQGLMTAFPDLRVAMDQLVLQDLRHATYHWTLTGKNTGPGGTGNYVKVSGYEQWEISDDDLIMSSLGHFDEGEFGRQLNKEQ